MNQLRSLESEIKPSDILKGFLKEIEINGGLEKASIDDLKMIVEFLPELLLQNRDLNNENISLKGKLSSVQGVINSFNHVTNTLVTNLKQQILAVLK